MSSARDTATVQRRELQRGLVARKLLSPGRMSSTSFHKTIEFKFLTRQDHQNWGQFEALQNSVAQDTMERYLKDYDRSLRNYERHEAPVQYDQFKKSVGELKELYREVNRDHNLDVEERGKLRTAANGVDKNLVSLIERADLPPTAKAILERGASESSNTASPEKTTPRASGDSRAEDVRAEGASKDEKTSGFDGRYQNVAEKALDEVASGKTRLGVGSKGPAVREAQELMQKHGASFTKTDASGKVVKDYGADGFMGDVTKRELEKLQKQWGLPATGELDAPTMEKLRGVPEKQDASSSKNHNRAETQLQALTEREVDKIGQGLEQLFQSTSPASDSKADPSPRALGHGRNKQSPKPEVRDSAPAAENPRSGRTGRNKPRAEPQPQDNPLSPAPTPRIYLA